MSIASQTSRTTERRVFGVVEAIVMDVNDPAQEGRVKVQFPWFDENMISAWCRVCQVYAGPGYGAFWIPEVQDEVLAAFIHGDMRHPVILGGLYNGQDKPPTYRADDKNEKLFRTKAGHQILLVDTGGEERIVIVDKSEKQRIEISTHDNSITIKSDGGKLSLVGKEIEIAADQGLTVKAATIEATASGNMTLKGSTINLN